MKLFLIIPSLGSGGAERVLTTLANNWAKRKQVQLTMVVLSDSEDFYTLDEKIQIHRLGYKGGGDFLEKLVRAKTTVSKLRSLIKENDPNCILSFLTECNIVTLLASRNIKNKVFVSERDSPNANTPKIYKFLRKKLYNNANGIIVQSRDYQNFISKIVPKVPVVVIQNPIREIKRYDVQKEKVILNVGRLINEKGQKYLLEAFSRLSNHTDWKLVILGDGYLRDSLIEEANRLGISNQVSFMGASKEVDLWINKASIFAFSSISEGFPNALAEAMVGGLPCVSFDCVTGPKELIKNGENGYLVKTEDVEDFASKLNELINSEELRQSFSNNSIQLRSVLNEDAISDKYFNFITGKTSEI